MTTVSNPYETLYNNLKSDFAIVENGYELTLGASMLMRAERIESFQLLPYPSDRRTYLLLLHLFPRT